MFSFMLSLLLEVHLYAGRECYKKGFGVFEWDQLHTRTAIFRIKSVFRDYWYAWDTWYSEFSGIIFQSNLVA